MTAAIPLRMQTPATSSSTNAQHTGFNDSKIYPNDGDNKIIARPIFILKYASDIGLGFQQE